MYRSLLSPVVVIGLTLFASHAAFGQNTIIQIESELISRVLAGQVHVWNGGSAIQGVRVEICDKKWSRVFASTTTDENGNFSFPARPGGRFRLRLSLPNYNPLLIRVRLSRAGPAKLSLELNPAT